MTARVAETIYDGISPKRTQNNNVSSQKSPDYLNKFKYRRSYRNAERGRYILIIC